ncbi:MAG: N-ethylammeline chlorohydrolase [Frankiales bacterium]|nr:N-ethylammeline chlorohydrolase [Frankiales bacterium]
MSAELIIRNGLFLTMGPQGAVEGDLVVRDGLIAAIGAGAAGLSEAPEIDAGGAIVLPGLIQAHVHLGQTLFRGVSDDVDVVDWLHDWIWPLEQRHDEASMAASCRLGVAELLLGGTTTVLSMESVHHTDASFQAAADLGIRAFIGKALMDYREPGTHMFGESTADALADARRLLATWHGAEQGRLKVALSPRGPRNATVELWREVVKLAEEHELILHTHVNENRAQAERVALTGDGRDVVALAAWGALGPRLVMAHCVWPDEVELELMTQYGPSVCHCPSANLKLASGLAPVPTYLERGINVALGADGAACNNNLDAFQEMRLAALLHKPGHGPRAMPAATVLEMATRGGARALGMDREIGSLEVGKKADVVILRPDRAHSAPANVNDLASSIVYSRTAADVRTVLVDGRVVVQDGVLKTAAEDEIVAEAIKQRELILQRLEA